MSKYTAHTGKIGVKIDALIDSYLKVIVEEVKSKIDRENLVSIVLIGGFARGEGSVLIDKNKFHLLNDFDIFIITRKPVLFDVKELSLECLKKCGIKSEFSFKKSTGIMQFYIDFRNMTLEELKKTPPFIKYYEIKNSARGIYGENVLELIPDYSVRDIPLEEGLRHMFNRLSLLAEYLAPAYSANSIEEKRTAIFFIGKCYLSIAEAMLLYSGDFACSYKKRAEIFSQIFRKKFPELAREIPDLDKKVLLHTEMKLCPKDKNLDISKLWFEARNDTFQAIKFYMEKIYFTALAEIDVSSFSEMAEKVMKKNLFVNYLFWYANLRGVKSKFLARMLNLPSQWYFNYAFFREAKRLKIKACPQILLSSTDPGIKLYSSLILCLFSLDEAEKVDKSLYIQASDKLSKIICHKEKKEIHLESWKELCAEYTKAFRVFQFLKV